MTLSLDDVRNDIAAFADDDNDVIVDGRGDSVFYRGGVEVTCRVVPDASTGYAVEVDGQRLTYRRFVSHYLGRLDVFAERLLSKRQRDPAFINSPATLESVSSAPTNGPAIDMLHAECSQPPTFSARVIFITADAGQGKTVLLREFQARKAKEFVDGASPYLFWHVDLQGRQLLRLHEALMGDLGELRVVGLFVPSIVTLLRHRVLVLAIDGFDELAAEQGTMDALGALAQLVEQLGNSGTIVAASRRTFFDTEDYLKRTRLLRRSVASQCEFDQIHLGNWTEKEVVQYLEKVCVLEKQFDDPQAVYTSILTELHDDRTHPMLTRPFLVAHIARALLLYDMQPAEIVSGATDPMESVQSVVEAFTEREVEQKWRTREGKPYLSKEQHLKLLAVIAEEMWRLQKDRLRLDVVEEIAAILLEEWKVDEQRQVVEMVRMHVLLPFPADGDAAYRSFDHPEFQHYFVAYALAEAMMQSMDEGRRQALGRFLAIAQLPESVARYCAVLIPNRPQFVPPFLSHLETLVASERRPTFLQTNVGTVVPYLLHKLGNSSEICFAAKVAFSTLAFENTQLKHICFAQAQFINCSFGGCDWENVRFTECEFTEVTLDRSAAYKGVAFEDCDIASLIVMDDGQEVAREYSPLRVQELLKDLNIQVIEAKVEVRVGDAPASEARKLVHKMLRNYRRATALTDNVIQLKFGKEAARVSKEIIPLMRRYGLVELDTWRGGGRPQHRWVLTRSVEEIQRADGKDDKSELSKFWQEVNEG